MKVNIIIIKIYNNIEKCVDISLLLILKHNKSYFMIVIYLNILFEKK